MSNYQVRTLPEKTLLNLEALATTVENAEIAIEDVEKMLSNFQLDNLHTSRCKSFVFCNIGVSCQQVNNNMLQLLPFSSIKFLLFFFTIQRCSTTCLISYIPLNFPLCSLPRFSLSNSSYFCPFSELSFQT